MFIQRPVSGSRCGTAARGVAVWLLAVSFLSGVVLTVLWMRRPAAPPPAPDPVVGTPASPAATYARPPAPPAFPPPRPILSEAVERMIFRLLDAREPLAARRKMARELAQLGSDEAMQALRMVYPDAPPYLRAAIAEALGLCPHPEADAFLLEIVTGPDEVAARGALRGLAARGDPAAIEVLHNVLFDATKPVSLRTEAALALGEVKHTDALTALSRALDELKNPAVLENVMESLGRRPLSETEAIWKRYLERRDISVDLRVAALEAVGNSPEDVGEFLLNYAGDSDPEVRAAVGWALSAAEEPGDISTQLLAWLNEETDPNVRERLYQALANQDSVDATELLPDIERETDEESRLAAFEFLAGALQASSETELLRYFETTAVPELHRAALSGQVSQGLVAVMALDRSGSTVALAALAEIAQRAVQTRVREAAVQALARHAMTESLRE